MQNQFICIGNVRKGLSVYFIRKRMQIPDRLIFIIGLPQEHEKMSVIELANSIFWGVYLRDVDYEQYLQEKEVIKPNRRHRKILLLTIFVVFFIVFVKTSLTVWLAMIFFLSLLWLSEYKTYFVNSTLTKTK